MHTIAVVLKKEFKDGRRDRRALMSAFLFPILAPVLVYFLLTTIIEMRGGEEATTVPVMGAEHAPELIQWLQEQHVVLEEFNGDPDQAVRDQEVELVLIIPEDYQARLRAFDSIPLLLVQDGSRNDARQSVGAVTNLMRRFNNEIASLRLVARGVSPQLMQVTTVQNKDVASRQERTATALNFIPLYIILSAFVAGMGLAVDTTAGERERKSLEPLLLNPVRRHNIVLGKWLAASIFSALGMLLTLLLCIVAMLQVPLDSIGLDFTITWQRILLMTVGMAPLALLATSLQMMLGMFAKSFKDAQSYIGLLNFVPVLPMLYTMFNPVATQDWMYSIPILGQHLILVSVLGAKAVPLIAYFLSASTTLVISVIIALATAKFMERESILAS
jgi:sodium transport system permease protein